MTLDEERPPITYDTAFDSIPVRLNILGVDPSGTIHELKGMVDYSMATHIWETRNPVICRPFI